MIGTAQTRGTGADDGHRLAFLGDLGHRQGAPVDAVGHKPLQVADGDGLIHFLAAAVGLAGVGQTRPMVPGRAAVHDQGEGFGKLVLFDELDVPLGAEIGRAGPDTGARSAFLMAKVAGWPGDKAGKPPCFRQPQVEFVGHPHRADLAQLPQPVHLLGSM